MSPNDATATETNSAHSPAPSLGKSGATDSTTLPGTPSDSAGPSGTHNTSTSHPRMQDTEPDKVGLKEEHDAAENSWAFCWKAMDDHDTKLMTGWREELNNVLIFAGLFSAVVTGFVVESFTWLQQSPQDRSVDLLGQISAQLTSFTISPTFLNSTVPARLAPPPVYHPSTTIIALNILWFFSLTLSLMAAVTAILVQQWLRQYLNFPLVTVEERVCLRQQRYNALHQWFVPQVISGLSVALQAALILFLTGLIALVWTLNQIVAVAITVLLAVLLGGLLLATILPLTSASCPYRSPLGWMCFFVNARIQAFMYWLICGVPVTILREMKQTETCLYQAMTGWNHVTNESLKCLSWSEYEDSHFRLDQFNRMNSLTWTLQTMRTMTTDGMANLAPCFGTIERFWEFLNWLAQESLGPQTSEIPSSKHILQGSITKQTHRVYWTSAAFLCQDFAQRLLQAQGKNIAGTDHNIPKVSLDLIAKLLYNKDHSLSIGLLEESVIVLHLAWNSNANESTMKQISKSLCRLYSTEGHHQSYLLKHDNIFCMVMWLSEIKSKLLQKLGKAPRYYARARGAAPDVFEAFHFTLFAAYHAMVTYAKTRPVEQVVNTFTLVHNLCEVVGRTSPEFKANTIGCHLREMEKLLARVEQNDASEAAPHVRDRIASFVNLFFAGEYAWVQDISNNSLEKSSKLYSFVLQETYGGPHLLAYIRRRHNLSDDDYSLTHRESSLER